MKPASNKPGPERYLLLLAAVLALLSGMWTGLVRLGWNLPLAGRPGLVIQHGPLMVSGFLGVLIPMERAVALEFRLAFVIPFLSAAGMLVLLFPDISPLWGTVPITIASAGYLGILLYLFSRNLELHSVVMVAGALSWIAGNMFWVLGWGLPDVVFYWIGFLVLTIAGERLELAQTLQLKPWRKWLFGAIGVLFIAGAVAMSLYPFEAIPRYVLSIGLGSLGIWLLVAGPSRRTVRVPGQTRFIAVNLLLGYGWLVAAAVVLAVFSWRPAGPFYDAFLHAVFLGFVFSMIFAHAPLIFPAITGKQMTFLHLFYSHTVLLHVSLALRMIGNLGGPYPFRTWGGFLNAIALLLFLVNTVVGILWSKSKKDS